MYRVNKSYGTIVFIQITIKKYQYHLVEAIIYENIVIEHYISFKYGCANCVNELMSIAIFNVIYI